MAVFSVKLGISEHEHESRIVPIRIVLDELLGSVVGVQPPQLVKAIVINSQGNRPHDHLIRYEAHPMAVHLRREVILRKYELLKRMNAVRRDHALEQFVDRKSTRLN